MISFACKRIELEELIKCSFGLNKTEFNVLQFLLTQNSENSLMDLSKKMDLDRTTVQKAVKGLLAKELIKRFQINLNGGGYLFVYKPKDKREIKEKMKLTLNSWVKNVDDEINKW